MCYFVDVRIPVIIAHVATVHNMHDMKIFLNKNALVKPPWSVWARHIGVVVRLGAAHIPLEYDAFCRPNLGGYATALTCIFCRKVIKKASNLPSTGFANVSWCEFESLDESLD